MDETSLKITTAQKEKFYVLKPVPVTGELETQLLNNAMAVSMI